MDPGIDPAFSGGSRGPIRRRTTAGLRKRSPACNHDYMSTDKSEQRASAAEKLRGWFTGRLPEEWLDGALDVKVDREEITVIVPIGDAQVADGASEAEQAAAWDGRSR